MEVKVTGCSDCPMFKCFYDERYGGWESNCGHPNFEKKGVVEEIDMDKDDNPITPQNRCPLLTEPIKIKAIFQVYV